MEEKQTENLVVDTSNLESIVDDMQNKVDDSMFELSMNMVWSFPDGESASSDAYVANAHSNHYAISFEVMINEEDVVFVSDVIPVGNRIKEIK